MKNPLQKTFYGRSIKAAAVTPLLLALLIPGFAAAGNGHSLNTMYSTRAYVNAAKAAVTVSGVVTDSKGQPVPGVTVAEKGTANAVSTDAGGNYKLTVAGADAVLVFTFVGYVSREVAVADKQTINIQLAEDVRALSEVVVVGYGTQRKADLTGAVASVPLKDVRSLPVPDIGQAIQGRAAGVQVISSGTPGSNVTIRVRGTGTINNSDPLIVVDGVPTDLPLNVFSPDDIASMDILKDASATAVYGSRGANGVVQITTKRGSSGKGKLDFKAFTGIQQATNMVDLLNASQFAALHNDMMKNNGMPLNPAYADPASFTKSTDWLGGLFRKAYMQNYSLAYSGGNERSTYYVAASVLNQNGIVINNNYKRYTVQFNGDSKVFNWLKFSNNFTLSHDRKQQGSINIRNAMAALPVQPVYNADGTWSGPEGQSSWYGDIRNPIGEATINDNVTTGYNVLGNISAEVTILPVLKFKTTGGIQAAFWDDRNWSPKYAWKPISQPFSTLAQSSNKSLTYLWDNFLTYDNYFDGEKHHLTVLAGTSAQNNRYDRLSASKANFISDGAQQLDNGTLLPTAGGNANDWSLFSLVGRVNYSLNNKYLITATVRRDGSSRFGANNRWGTFPSASVKWRLSEESFFKKSDLVNDVAIRAGYGITGNQNIGNYPFASILTTGQYVFNGQIVNSVVPFVLANPNVRWEEVEQANIGLDVTLIKGRINLTVDAYLKNTNDMLVGMNVPVGTGYSDVKVPSINLGKMRNQGIEVGINSDNIKGNFNWTTNFNFSYNKNEIISLNGDVPVYGGMVGSTNSNIQKKGLPVNSFYGFIANGLFQSQQEVDNYAIQQQGSDPNNSTAPGDIKFLDINNDGQVNDLDRTFIGDPNPRFTFAMNNSFAYKGFDLSIFLQGVEGNSIFNANRVFQEGMAVAQNQTTAVLNRWTGPNTGNTVPRAVFNDPNKNTRTSTRFIEDGSYLRIKNITLGYNLPKSLLQHASISSARIYLSGQNLHTFTKYTGFDPEVVVNGIDQSLYPVNRTISIGINVGL